MSLRTGLAHRAARALERRDHPHAAAGLLRALARGGSRDAVLLRALAAETALRHGTVPDGLPRLRVALARQADAARYRGDADEEARLLTRLAALTFHRVEHLDGARSPLAEDPDGFLAPLRGSTAWQALTAPGTPAPRRRRGTGPLRVAVVVDADRRFLDPLLPHLGDDVEVRVVSLEGWDGPALPLTPGAQVRARLARSVEGEPWAVELTRRVGDVDVVWVEWCQRAAVLAGRLRLGDAPMVVRLHSFEAFTVFPHLVDAARVDKLVTVSPAVAGLLGAVVPALGAKATVLPNAVDPAPFARPKTAEAATTLGVLGWGAPAKDAVWAAEVLAALRRRDPRWRMRLIGPAPDERTAGSRAYAEAVRERLARHDVVGAVDLVGPTEDVPAALQHVGALVSSSTRESFHLAVAEAVASGARVAVRDWPTLSRYGGPRGVWPEDWVVRTPEEAAALLLSDAPLSAAPDWSPARVGAAARALLESLA